MFSPKYFHCKIYEVGGQVAVRGQTVRNCTGLHCTERIPYWHLWSQCWSALVDCDSHTKIQFLKLFRKKYTLCLNETPIHVWQISLKVEFSVFFLSFIENAILHFFFNILQHVEIVTHEYASFQYKYKILQCLWMILRETSGIRGCFREPSHGLE